MVSFSLIIRGDKANFMSSGDERAVTRRGTPGRVGKGGGSEGNGKRWKEMEEGSGRPRGREGKGKRRMREEGKG